MTHLVKRDWFDRCIEVALYHKECLKSDSSWTIEKTAKTLNYSKGSVSQYLMVADWSKSFEKQIKRCNSLRDALEWIKAKKHEIRIS